MSSDLKTAVVLSFLPIKILQNIFYPNTATWNGISLFLGMAAVNAISYLPDIMELIVVNTYDPTDFQAMPTGYSDLIIYSSTILKVI